MPTGGEKAESPHSHSVTPTPGLPIPSRSQMHSPSCGGLEQQVPSLCLDACDSTVTSDILLKVYTQWVPIGTSDTHLGPEHCEHLTRAD